MGGGASGVKRHPPTHETYDRYRLEAIVADSNKEWKRADSFYEIAAGLTTTPASVLNNWGFSKRPAVMRQGPKNYSPRPQTMTTNGL